MMGRKARRTVAMIVALCIVALLLSSVLLVATHVHRGFYPQSCPTCAKIENYLTAFKTVSAFLALCAGLRLFASFSGECRLSGGRRFFGDSALFARGIRLNN
jgi:hypothetical protein